MKKALIFYGGWDGHEPDLVSQRIQRHLEAAGYDVDRDDHQDRLADLDTVRKYDLIVPCWTMGEIPGDYVSVISQAVGEGVGLAGVHGGMCDAFRTNEEWQFMCGGQWVSHPGGDGVDYEVNICKGSSPLVEGLEDFRVKSEQYYLHVDPAVEILATTRFPVVTYYHSANKPVDMPVAWTKFWGLGRVFYLSLGHHDDVFDNSPTADVMLQRGLLWAGAGKEFAHENELSADRYLSDAKMY